MVHLSLLFTEKAFANPSISEVMKSLSLTDYREFSATDETFKSYIETLGRSVENCPSCSSELPSDAKFCPNCGNKIETSSIVSALLDETVDSLSISDAIKTRLKTKYATVGEVLQATTEDIRSISYIAEVRSKIIKNAAEEFISG